MPRRTIRQFWDDLNRNFRIGIIVGFIGFIFLAPINIVVIPFSIIGTLFLLLAVSVGFLIVVLFTILILWPLTLLILGIGHLIVNLGIYLFNLGIEAINSLGGSPIPTMDYINILASLPTTIFFLYDPVDLFDYIVFVNIVLSEDSILLHLLGLA
jgi:hypothetical protein